MKLLHEWSNVVFDCAPAEYFVIHRDIPNGSPKLKLDRFMVTVGDGSDCHDFVVLPCSSPRSIVEVDLAGVHNEGTGERCKFTPTAFTTCTTGTVIESPISAGN